MSETRFWGMPGAQSRYVSPKKLWEFVDIIEFNGNNTNSDENIAVDEGASHVGTSQACRSGTNLDVRTDNVHRHVPCQLVTLFYLLPATGNALLSSKTILQPPSAE